MPIQLSTTTRNRLRDAIVAAFPAGASLVIRTGAPAGVGNTATGTVLATITLPATPLAVAAGQVTLSGTWSATAAGTGTAGHYRLTNGSDIEEGTVTGTGGGGDLTLDNVNIASAQLVTVTSWTRTMPHA